MRLPFSFLSGPLAHRALHDRAAGRPENALSSVRAAMARGIGIEIDVQPSSDGVAMAFHDALLNRLTDLTGPVDSLSAEALAATTLRGGREGVPTLAQVLDLVAGKVPILIEIKDRDGDMGPEIGPLEDAVIADLDGYHGDVAVMSFNPHSVDHMRRNAAHLPRGLTTSAFDPRHWPELTEATRARLRDMPDLQRLEVDFISHEVGALSMPQVAQAKAAGLSVLCWTVRSKAQEIEARHIADTVTFEGYLP